MSEPTESAGLRELVVENLRCLARAELTLDPHRNLIWGANGSGKTSLLEAIFLLGRGRSFRTRNSERLIRHGQARLTVLGRTGGAWPTALGVQVSRGTAGGSGRVAASEDALPSRVQDAAADGGGGGAAAGGSLPGRGPDSAASIHRRQPRGPLQQSVVDLPGAGRGLAADSDATSGGTGTVARINGAPVASLTELSQAFPVQVIDPGVHKLVEEGGFRRRRWMDWVVFHVEPAFADWWVRYTRAVKQRNAALKHHPAQASAWDLEVARLGELIAEARRKMLHQLEPLWRETNAGLSELGVDLHYSRGWAQDVSLAQALADGRARDQAKGLTHAGPHRADVSVRLGGRPAREVLSRGQQKLAAIAMTLAQIRLLQQQTATTPTLLLDDPAAELDGERLERFIAQVSQLKCQLVLTSLQPHFEVFGRAEKVFHVEQGRVASV